jgi:hypothetical protein
LLFTLSRWFFPVHELPNVPAVVALAIFSCLLVLIVMHIFRTDSVRVKTILLTSCFILCYALFLIRMSIYSNDPIHERYMAPIFIPFMFLILAGFYQCANFSERFFPNPKMYFAVLVIFGFWLLYPTAMTFRQVIIKFHDGAGGYSTKQYQNSMMLQWVQQYPWDGIIYSNWHDIFYLFSNQKAKLLPRKSHDLLQFRQSLRQGERYYIVWFSQRFRYGVYSLDEYRQILTLRAIKHFPEGDIYEIQLPDSS